MPPPRPKGIGCNTGVTPMSERQQMALLLQMTSTDSSRPHSKKNDKKTESDVEISTASEKHEMHDSKDKTATDDAISDVKKETNLEQNASTSKRNYSDVEEECEEVGDDNKKKKRKDSDSTKEVKSTNLKCSSRLEKNLKLSSSKGSPLGSKGNAAQPDKEPPEIAKSFEIENDTEVTEDYKSNDSLYNGGLKVPPLKIVIPQQNCSIDTDGNVLRTGKIATSRNAALPYVVSSNSDSIDSVIPTQGVSPHESPHKVSLVLDDKNLKLCHDDKNLRVLRSSHRSGVTSAERSSNNSSPQMQSSSPSPASSNHANESAEVKVPYTAMSLSPLQPNQFDQDPITNVPSPSTSSTSSSKEIQTNSNLDVHPRKRKMRPKNSAEDGGKNQNNESSLMYPEDAHPHDFPFTNGFQMFLNIRRQIERKWKNLYPINPRPPQGFKDYLLTKRSYLLHDATNPANIFIPATVPRPMNDVYTTQEKARQELKQRHTVEKEKLCLNVEQEIIRVHSKAARSISGQSAPYSVCTYLKDDEVYNMITPEQDEKEKSARCRFNGRLLLSWLQDVDDKWEKIKESMVLRHHNEAESLHAVQLMEWKIYLKRNKLCDFIFETDVEKDHVPIVYVGEDFDLLPS